MIGLQKLKNLYFKFVMRHVYLVVRRLYKVIPDLMALKSMNQSLINR